MGTDRNLGVSLREKEEKKKTRIHEEETQSYSLAGRSSTSSFSVLAKEISYIRQGK